MGLTDMIMNAIASNKDIQEKINQDPTSKEYYDTLRRGDQKSGEALANKILQQHGLTKEMAIKQAQEGLQKMFGGQ